jgi:hypothetical protein
LTPEALGHCYAVATGPKARNPGARFLDEVKRCRKNGGNPPAPKVAKATESTQHAPESAPTATPHDRLTIGEREAVVKTVIDAARRAGPGVNPADSRAAVHAEAESDCDARGLSGQSREDYLESVTTALAHVLDGIPVPKSAECLRRCLGHEHRRIA